MGNTILGGNGNQGAYEITNSGCFQLAGTFLTRSQSDNESDADRRKFTLSLWTKQTLQGSASGWHGLWSASVDANNYTSLKINSDRYLVFGSKISGTEKTWTSTMKFLDPTAWYHIVCAFDSTDGTAADRFKVYVNGSQITGAFSSDLTQNISADWGHDGADGRIGAYNNNTGDSYMMNGYLADVILTVGYALAPTLFGEENDNGVWVPKNFAGTYSANGFKLEFKQTGTSANASGLGADTSGNDNHFTIDADTIALDSTTDTPSNNFATLNPIDIFDNDDSDDPNITHGNRVFDSNSASAASMVSTIAPSAGKWYCEVKALSSTMTFGVCDIANGASHTVTGGGALRPQIDYTYGGDVNINGSDTDDEATWTTNDIIGIAMNLDDNNVIFYKNGTAINSGTAYAFGSSPVNAAFYVQTHTGGSATSASFNFGNPVFSISSGNSDANGYGNFEYSVPTNHYALCTKNLAEFG